MPYPERIRKIARLIEANFEKECAHRILVEDVTDTGFWADVYEWKKHGLEVPDEHEARMAIGCLLKTGFLVRGPHYMLYHPGLYPNTSRSEKKKMKPGRRRKRRA